MTATVRLIHCRREQFVPLETVSLIICTDDPAMNGCRFTCEECGERQIPVNPSEIEALRAAQVRVIQWSKRNLPSIPPSVQALPPLTLDDAITAHFTLPSELDVLLGRAA